VSIRLRPMRWWDIAQAAELERELFADDPWSEAGFWSELAGVPANRFYLVAEQAEDDSVSAEVVGYAGLLTVGAEADVQTVAVSPRLQGTGLGGRMVGGLLEEAERRRCTQILLEVREDNHAARRLYERFGFEPIARRSAYYGPGGDAVVMRLAISSDRAGRTETGGHLSGNAP